MMSTKYKTSKTTFSVSRQGKINIDCEIFKWLKYFYYKNVNTKYTIKWLINNNFDNTITIFTITITLFTKH